MLGTKFGTTGREYQTWAVNTYLAGAGRRALPPVALHRLLLRQIYPLRPVTRGGADERSRPIRR